MKSGTAPGDKALNSSHNAAFNKGAAMEAKDATKRRSPRGTFPNGKGPTQTDLRRTGRKNTAFDAGGNMAGGTRIPWSRIQRTA